MPTLTDIMDKLEAKARPDQLQGMARYGMTVEKRLGVRVPEMRTLAKEIGRNHQLALDLWQTGVPEARMLASMVDNPSDVTSDQMDEWVKDFNSWDVCDQVCMNLFDKTPHVWQKIMDWSLRQEEYVKRAAFTLIACLAWHDKQASDEKFIDLVPIIKKGATDHRNYVKKAVSWALRHMGKRNKNLNEVALKVAQELKTMDSKTARWIGADANRDLTSETTRRRLKSNSKNLDNQKPGSFL